MRGRLARDVFQGTVPQRDNFPNLKQIDFRTCFKQHKTRALPLSSLARALQLVTALDR